MPVPSPFVEIQPPWMVSSGGQSMSAGNETTDPRWPVCLRAALIGRLHEWKSLGPDPSVKLRRFPGWFLYGGPVERRYAKSLEQYLAQWAFNAAQPALGEPGFFVAAEQRMVAPPTPSAPWPADSSVRWQWSYEARRPYRYRLIFAGLAGGHWQKAGGGEVAGLEVGALVPQRGDGAGFVAAALAAAALALDVV